MSPDPPPPAATAVRPRRPAWAVQGERALEALVRLCGVSAIVFVAAIFFFVLREAAPVLVKDDFSLVQFLFSGEWYPTSASNVRYGTFALTVGTLSVTALAMAARGAVRPRSGHLPVGVLRPARARDAQDHDRAPVCDPERRLGLRRPHGDEPADRLDHRRARRRQRAERRHHPRAHERAGDRLDRRGRAQGGARLVPRGGDGARRDALAARVPRAAAGRAQRPAGGRAARASAAPWARRWPC